MTRAAGSNITGSIIERGDDHAGVVTGTDDEPPGSRTLRWEHPLSLFCVRSGIRAG
jgi:hypothetical protein